MPIKDFLDAFRQRHIDLSPSEFIEYVGFYAKDPRNLQNDIIGDGLGLMQQFMLCAVHTDSESLIKLEKDLESIRDKYEVDALKNSDAKIWYEAMSASTTVIIRDRENR